jgi:hypothetical protein
MMWKVGQEVRCVDVSDLPFSRLTLNKIYTIVRIDVCTNQNLKYSGFCVFCDEGYISFYIASRFVLVPEFKRRLVEHGVKGL